MLMHKLRNWLINRAWRSAKEYNDQDRCTNTVSNCHTNPHKIHQLCIGLLGFSTLFSTVQLCNSAVQYPAIFMQVWWCIRS